MRFIFALFALAGAACVVLIFFQPGSLPKLALTQSGAAQTPAHRQKAPTPAPAARATARAPARAPAVEPRPAPAPAPVPAQGKPVPPPAAAAAPTAARPLSRLGQSAPALSGSAARPAAIIHPPQGLEGIAFGMSANQVAARFPIAWRKETADSLMLVYYPHGQGDEVQFTFTRKGLSRLELLLKPPRGQSSNQFYQAVRENYTSVYGGLPGTAGNGWSDGHTVLRISPAPTGVSVLFYPE